MIDFNTITEVADHIKSDLLAQNDKKSVALLYAFNATGKTRLSRILSQLNQSSASYDGSQFNYNDSRLTYGGNTIRVLSYDAFLEDAFTWNNEEHLLNFDNNNRLLQLVMEKENDIKENFGKLTNSRVEPAFDWYRGSISFDIRTGDDTSVAGIKVSRSEENILIWSIFYTIIEMAIDELNLNSEDRSTEIFNHLEYIVIDDPVSSIDDERIISLAVKLSELIKTSQNKEINFLLTTHHALFFNVLFNSFRKLSSKYNKRATDSEPEKRYYYFYIFSKNENILTLERQGDDSPFAYHILIKNKLKEAIESGGLEKYHFNLFRTLLEKTASFLGYNAWSGCILDESIKSEIVRMVNFYSHSKLSDLESGSLSNREKELFTQAFNAFVEDFKFQ